MKRTSILRKAKLKRSPFKRKKAKDAEEASAFSKAVLARDEKCRRCLWRKATEAHHVVPRARSHGHPNRHHPLVGIGLCFVCHRHVHDTNDTAWLKGRDYLDTL